MTQVPDAAPQAALLAQDRAAHQFLEDGEAILLALRPSLWFVPLVSAPFVIGVTLLAAAVHYGGPYVSLLLPDYALTMLWVIALLCRFSVASIQWMGRLYLLTNRRVITVQGVARFRVRQCPLPKVVGVEATATRVERPLGLGTLWFHVADGAEDVGPWVNLARPAQVMNVIEQAIRRGGK